MASVEKVGGGTDRLPVRLTEEDLLDFGLKLARIQAERAEHDKNVESAKRAFKAKEAELEAKREFLSTAIANGEVNKEVPVEHWADWSTNRAWTVRLDTGERYGERALSAEERQSMLDFLGKSAGVRP